MLRQVAISCLLVALALPAVARTRPHYGGTLRVEIEGDPWAAGHWRESGAAAGLRWAYRWMRTERAQPALAVRWASENSDHRWQFWLRPGVHFHDGTPLTGRCR